MDPAAPEASSLARGEEPAHRLTVVAEHPGGQVGLEATEGLAREDVQLDRDEGPLLGVGELVGRVRPLGDLVPAVLPCHVHRRDLRVLAVRVVQLGVPRLDRGPHLGGVELGLTRLEQPVHLRDELLDGVGLDEVDPLVEEGLDGWGHVGERASQQDILGVLAGEVEVLLRPRERKLLARNGPVGDEPRVVMTTLAQVRERAEGVVAGEERGGEPLPRRVEPQRARAGQDPDAVAGPDGVPVADALDVVPHPVAVDEPAAGRLGDLDHPTVDIGGHAGDHVPRGLTEPLRPVGTHEVVVAADAAARDEDGLGPELEVADGLAVRRLSAAVRIGCEDGPAHADDGAALDDDLVDAVPVGVSDEACLLGLGDAGDEGGDDARPGPPGDVEAGDGVAVTVGGAVTTLGPPDDGEPAHPLLVEPRPLLPRGEVDVRLGPQAGPVVLVAVEAGGPPPVTHRELVAVLDAHASLLGAVDEEQTAEGPVRLAAEVGLRLLVDEEHPATRIGELRGGDEPGEAVTHDDDISVHGR